MKVKTIVVGIDGSADARDALDTAIDLVADDGVIHVVAAFHAPSSAEINRVLAALPREFKDTYDPLAEPHSHLHDAEALMAASGVEGRGHFIEDHPAAAILDVADLVGADLIIVGSRGIGQSTRFLRGSVSARVANRAKTSFMVIHNTDNDT